MLKKLRVKFICITMAIVTVMLCVMFGMVLHFTRQSMERESLSLLRTVAFAPLRQDRPNDRPEQVRLPFFRLEVGKDGSLTATGSDLYDLSDEAFLQTLFTRAEEYGADSGQLREYGLRFLTLKNPHARVVIFADTSSETRMLEGLAQSCVLIGLVSLGAFWLVSIVLARWAVKPVEEAWQQQRQFVADASHELKTPLSVIMTNAELLALPEYDGQEKGRFADNILTMSRQMRGLVERLLELARSDSGTRESLVPVDLSGLATDAALPFEPVFFEAGLSFSTRIEDGLTVSGSAAQLRQLVDILLDNARKYSAPNAAVSLTLARQGRAHCLLAVANGGAALSEEERKNIFKRFYRADPARTRDGGYGLGLSIAEGIVRVHAGKLWVESADGVNTFSVLLPRAAD